MASPRRVTSDTAISGATVADGDLFDAVDVSDATDAGTGTNKKITAAEVAVAMRTRITAGGDASGPLSALVLANSGVSAGTYGDPTHSARLTINAKGLVTAASSVSISGAGGGSPLPLLAPGVNGVVGDGVANDTTAVQTVLSANAGQTIFVIEGTYAVVGLSLPADTTLTFDPGATFKKRANGDLLTIGSRSVVVGGVLDLQGGSFTGQGLMANAAVDVRIERVTTSNTAAGSASMLIQNGSQRAHVTGCHIAAFTCVDSSGLIFEGNWVIGAGNGNTFYNSQDTAHPIDDAIITGNYFENTGVAANVDYMVTIGIFNTATVTAKRITFANNVVACNGTGLDGCLSVIKTDDSTVTGNILWVKGGTVNAECMELASCNRVEVSGNRMDCNAIAVGGAMLHGNVDCAFEDNVISNPATASSNGITVLTDSVTFPTQRCKVAGNTVVLNAGSASSVVGILVLTNVASAVLEDVDIIGNTVTGNANASTGTTGLALRVSGGSIDRVHVSDNRFRNHRFGIEIGGTCTVLDFANNTISGVGQLTFYVSSGSTTDVKLTNNSWQYLAAVPVTNDWFVGNEVKNTAPAAGSPPAWVCTVKGFPGTWKAYANLV